MTEPRPDEPVSPVAPGSEPAATAGSGPEPADVSASAAEPSAPAAGDPAAGDPAAVSAPGPVASDPEPAASTPAAVSAPGPVASDPEPAVSAPGPAARAAPEPAQPRERRGGGDRGAWGAVTDPVGQPAGGTPPAGRPAPAGQRADGRPPARAVDRSPGRPADSQPGRVVSRPGQSRRPDTRRPDTRRQDPRSGQSGGAVLTDLQRWLLRSGAKSMRREIEGQVRRTFNGGKRAERDDVWGTATTEPPPGVGEAPECAWCPICRAARRMRESGPGLGSQLSGAPSVVAAAVQDAIVAFDTVLSRSAAAPGQERPADRSPASGSADSASDEAEGSQDEPGDRR
jgi:hypothetical protein